MVTFLYCISHAYIYICLRRAFGKGPWRMPTIAWLLLMLFAWTLRYSNPAGLLPEMFQIISRFWLALLIFMSYCLAACDLLALAARLAARYSKASLLQRPASFLIARRYVPLALCASILLCAYAVFEALTPRVTPLALTSDTLAADAPPLRIVAVSDIHISSINGPFLLRRMADAISAEQPDILLVAGDLVDTDLSRAKEQAAIMRSIPAPLGKFAVTGNHEHRRGKDMALAFMRQSGLRVLRGQWVECGGIVIAGVDDDRFAEEQKTIPETDVPRMLATAPKNRFILLVKHKPLYEEAEIGLFDLQFSGHTHGGQIWPAQLMTRLIYGVPQGLSIIRSGKKRSALFVTNGLGFWGPPIRFLAPPEIVVITLSGTRPDTGAKPPAGKKVR